MFKNHTLTHSFYLVTTKLKFILTVINIIWNEDSGLHRYINYLIQEDHIIILLVKQHGRKKWTLIADEMQKISQKNSRTSKQIR